MNGLPVIRFNGTSSELHDTLSTYPPGTFTVYAVAQSNAPQVCQTQGGVNNRILSLPTTSDDDWSGGICVDTGTDNAFSRTIYSTSSTLAAGQGLSVYGLGQYFNPEGTGGVGFDFSGDIAEVIIYNRTLTSTENTQVMSYLDNKYNIGANGTVLIPTYSPAAGAYSSAQSVTISTATSGATIRYTTDGSTPSETQGTVYSAPVNISATTTLNAIAYESGMTDSPVDSGVYTIEQQVAAPSYSPAAGTYTSAQSVTISTTTSGATIRYTTDGSTPSESAGTVYSSPVNISATSTLNAIAYESGMADSTVTSGVYTITGTCAAPTFNPAAGTYSWGESVTISTTTSGATIRYTTNGTTPSSTVGTVYSSPVAISSTSTLEAIAYETGWNNSTVTSGVYTINGTLGTTSVGSSNLTIGANDLTLGYYQAGGSKTVNSILVDIKTRMSTTISSAPSTPTMPAYPARCWARPMC